MVKAPSRLPRRLNTSVLVFSRNQVLNKGLMESGSWVHHAAREEEEVPDLSVPSLVM